MLAEKEKEKERKRKEEKGKGKGKEKDKEKEKDTEKEKVKVKEKKKGVISNISWETREKSASLREKSLEESLTQIQYEVTSLARWVGLSEMHFSLYKVSESSLCFLSQLIFSGKEKAYGQTSLVNCEAQENNYP